MVSLSWYKRAAGAMVMTALLQLAVIAFTTLLRVLQSRGGRGGHQAPSSPASSLRDASATSSAARINASSLRLVAAICISKCITPKGCGQASRADARRRRLVLRRHPALVALTRPPSTGRVFNSQNVLALMSHQPSGHPPTFRRSLPRRFLGAGPRTSSTPREISFFAGQPARSVPRALVPQRNHLVGRGLSRVGSHAGRAGDDILSGPESR